MAALRCELTPFCGHGWQYPVCSALRVWRWPLSCPVRRLTVPTVQVQNVQVRTVANDGCHEVTILRIATRCEARPSADGCRSSGRRIWIWIWIWAWVWSRCDTAANLPCVSTSLRLTLWLFASLFLAACRAAVLELLTRAGVHAPHLREASAAVLTAHGMDDEDSIGSYQQLRELRHEGRGLALDVVDKLWKLKNATEGESLWHTSSCIAWVSSARSIGSSRHSPRCRLPYT